MDELILLGLLTVLPAILLLFGCFVYQWQKKRKNSVFTDIFSFTKHLTRYPAYAGKTVYKSEYDIVYRWFEERRDELERVRKWLEPFATTGYNNEDHVDSTESLAYNAHELLKASTHTIKQLTAESEQLLDQLTELRNIETERDELRQRVTDLEAMLDAKEEQPAGKPKRVTRHKKVEEPE